LLNYSSTRRPDKSARASCDTFGDDYTSAVPNFINATPNSEQAFATLRRFVRSRAAVERCELCGLELAHEHRHLLETANRKIACACDPCALRFTDVVSGKFKLIPRDARVLADFRIDDAQWDEFALPINLVFFFHDSVAGKLTALYPGPAGVTESLLRLDAWQTLVEKNPALARMEPDVEALLVNRVGETREYFIAPIDVCFELVGLIRMHWRGLSGGSEVWHEIGEFFDRLKARSKTEVAARA
jgi:hypothetical protein